MYDYTVNQIIEYYNATKLNNVEWATAQEMAQQV